MKFEYFQAVNGLWYWRVIAQNKKVVATGGEGYASKSNAKRSAKRLQASIVTASLDD
jgi:uncharacterized protein YegP (UPF0339 family)